MTPTEIITVLLCLAGGEFFTEAAPSPSSSSPSSSPSSSSPSSSSSSSSELVRVSIAPFYLYPGSYKKRLKIKRKPSLFSYGIYCRDPACVGPVVGFITRMETEISSADWTSQKTSCKICSNVAMYYSVLCNTQYYIMGVY